jgi:hypothetical protein
MNTPREQDARPPPSAARDLHLLIRKFDFGGPATARAIRTTFRRRATPTRVSKSLCTGTQRPVHWLRRIASTRMQISSAP